MVLMWDYSDKVRDHYLHPRNVGEVEHPDGIGEIGNLKCGDALRLTFKLDSDKRISDIKFKTFGCGSAIASSSVLTEMCKGKTLDEASKITNQDIAQALGGLPSAKMHCSVMGQEALEAAIHYYTSGGQVTVHKEKEGTIVCTCFNVTDKEIEAVIRSNHLTTVEEVTNFTKAGGGCGGCVTEITRILDAVNGVQAETPVISTPKLTTLQKIDKIKAVIQENIRPLLHNDGGDVELIDVNGDEVYIQFKGHCAHCSNASVTQYSLVEKILKEKVSSDLIVKLAE
jgi:NifU-like protein